MQIMREEIEFDVIIVGAGPAGLSAAIKIRQLAAAQNKDISVCIVEKGSEVGAHILSGGMLDPRALNELIPDWKEKKAPLHEVKPQDEFRLLFKKFSLRLPTPPQMKNEGNYIISLGILCKWLAVQAEELGVQIFTGFAAVDTIIENDKLLGIITGDFGVAKDGTHKQSYQQGIVIKAKVTLLAEGCRGSLSERIMEQFNLREKCDPQTYAIGVKEIWQVPPEKHQFGRVIHTVGYPLVSDTYGGSFIYHTYDNRVAIGFVVGLDYKNPYLQPFMELQKFKTHPFVKNMLKGGKRISYGARALNEGGYQSIPKLTFNGGVLIGCSAGFVDVPKIKGIHNAMKSGICAAEAVFDNVANDTSLDNYESKLAESWVTEELYKSRNIRPSFHKGLWFGLLYSAFDTYIMRGRAFWTFKSKKPDNESLKPASECKKIEYSQPDGELTFDRLSSLAVSGVAHEENQPVHLHLKNKDIPVTYNLPLYDEPAQRYCPAGVYEIIYENDKPRFQINAQNCVHCKTCDIKDPTQNIKWTPPEGGGGPNYSEM